MRNSLEASRETVKDLDLRLRCAEANLVSAEQAASLEAPQDAAQHRQQTYERPRPGRLRARDRDTPNS